MEGDDDTTHFEDLEFCNLKLELKLLEWTLMQIDWLENPFKLKEQKHKNRGK
jgi:hypothetical protein